MKTVSYPCLVKPRDTSTSWWENISSGRRILSVDYLSDSKGKFAL